MGKPEKTKTNFCPSCHKLVDCASGLYEAPFDAIPREGDISICLYCQNLNVFDSDGALRAFSDEDYEALDPDLKFKLAWAQMKTKYFLEDAEEAKRN